MKQSQQQKETLYRIPGARKYLDDVVTEKTIRAWVWRGQIDTVRVGRVVCIPQSALDRIIEIGRTPAREAR